MAEQIKLGYTDQDTSSAATASINVNSIKGWYDFDDVRLFPGLLHNHLSGAFTESGPTGLNRIITIDFGIVSAFADRKAILYWLMDGSRTINLVISAPTNLACGSPTSGGTLVDDLYYYSVSAVDAYGKETTGATEDSETTATPNSQIPLTWDAVSGASSYRVYRSLASGDYSGACYITEVTTNSYTDDGTVARGSESSLHVLPTVQSLTVALVNPGGFSNTWEQNIRLGRRFVVQVYDKTLRTALIP